MENLTINHSQAFLPFKIKNLFVLLFSFNFFLISVSFAQGRVGFSEAEIKKDIAKYDFEVKYNESGSKYITYDSNYGKIFYILDEDNICTHTIISPHNQGALNFYAELFNKNYAIISDTEWKMYSEEGIMNIKLIYPDEGNCYIIMY